MLAGVMTSRLYLGAHTVTQILLGVGYGYMSSAILILYLREPTINLLMLIMMNKYKLYKLKPILYSFLIQFLFIGLSFACWGISKAVSNDDKDYWLSIIKLKETQFNKSPHGYYKEFENGN